MLVKTEAHQALHRFFKRQPVAALKELFALLGTRSRMSVFRRLSEVGYQTSFTHSGRYYTLAGIPCFDEQGLWFVEEVGFSRRGSLMDTVPALVAEAPAGLTHRELEALLRVRVFNTLRVLLDEERVGRERRGRTHLYVSPDAEQAAGQLARREEAAGPAAGLAVPPPSLVLEVMVEAIRASGMAVDVRTLAARLAARGVEVTPAQVRQICEEHGLRPEKKTAE